MFIFPRLHSLADRSACTFRLPASLAKGPADSCCRTAETIVGVSQVLSASGERFTTKFFSVVSCSGEKMSVSRVGCC